MESFLNRAVRLLSKNWKKLAKPITAIASLLGAASIGAGMGAFFERRRARKEKAKLEKVVRKHEAAILALEAKSKKSLMDKRRIKELENEIEGFRRQIASTEETLQND